MNIIDLTHNVRNGMMIYPGDPEIAILEGLVHEKDYCHVDRLHLNSHTGTHIDAPLHFIPEGKTITDFPIDKFVLKGIALDFRHKKEGEAITAEEIKEALKGRETVLKDFALIIVSGWYENWGEEKYKNHPYISKSAAEYIVSIGTSIVAVDFLNVDQTLVEAWDAHPVLLGADTLIVENLNNTKALDFEKIYSFSFLPLKISGTDGSPIRAVAME